MHLIYRNTCRVCGSDSLRPVIDLGEQYLQGSFIKEGKELPSMRKIPCELVRCDPMTDENACGLLQMRHSVPSQILYSAYWYRSGINNTMREHLKGIADRAMEIWGGSAANVLDIGCNDGTLLKQYPSDFLKFGVDLALKIRNVLPEVGKYVLQVILEFSSETKFEFFAIHRASPPSVEIQW